MKLMMWTGFSGEDKKIQMRLERLICVFFVLETEIWFSAFIFNLLMGMYNMLYVLAYLCILHRIVG